MENSNVVEMIKQKLPTNFEFMAGDLVVWFLSCVITGFQENYFSFLIIGATDWNHIMCSY